MSVAIKIVEKCERGFMLTNFVVLLKTDSTTLRKDSLFNFENCISIFVARPVETNLMYEFKYFEAEVHLGVRK